MVLRNDLDRVAALRAEYRDLGEAGVLAQGLSALLVANCASARSGLHETVELGRGPRRVGVDEPKVA